MFNIRVYHNYTMSHTLEHITLSADAAPFAVADTSDARAVLIKKLVEKQAQHEELEHAICDAKKPVNAADIAVAEARYREEVAKQAYTDAIAATKTAQLLQTKTAKVLFDLENKRAVSSQEIMNLKIQAGIVTNTRPPGVLNVVPHTTRFVDIAKVASPLPAPVVIKPVARSVSPVQQGCDFQTAGKLCGKPCTTNSSGNTASFCEEHFKQCAQLRAKAAERRSRK